jgi:vancomycin resistance protein YoaR
MEFIAPSNFRFEEVVILSYKDKISLKNPRLSEVMDKLEALKMIESDIDFIFLDKKLPIKIRQYAPIKGIIESMSHLRYYYDPLFKKSFHKVLVLELEYFIEELEFERLYIELETLNIDPQDASFKIVGDEVIVQEGAYGKKPDRLGLFKAIKKPITKNTFEVPMEKVMPTKTTEDILTNGPYTLMSSYSTKFDPNNINRTHNIMVAANNIDGFYLKPGDTFSYNQVVGRRTEENGFRHAMIVRGSEFVPGLGGGICQLSSTLYMAVLLADLEIVERSSHGLAITYISLGLDATVAWDTLDFKFKNSSPYNLYIKTEVINDTLTVKIFGGDPPNVSYYSDVLRVYEPQTIKRYDPSLPKGKEVILERGQQGYLVETFKVQNGQTKSIGTSSYRPMSRVVMVGTKEN